MVFLVTGRAKAPILERVRQGPFVPQQLPAQAIRPNNGRLYWLVDRAAAANLNPASPNPNDSAPCTAEDDGP